MRKKRYERRKAIDCKLLEKSKKNPGYCKYEVTIQEKNGYIHKEPAYGKDMQDAISRLIWNERTRIIEKKLGAGWFFLAWLAIMGWPAIMLERTDNPTYILYAFAGVIILLSIGFFWWRYLNKK